DPIPTWRLSRRGLLVSAGALAAVGACRPAPEEPAAEAPASPEGPAEGSLAWAVAGPWRAADRARDAWRHPVETLEFLEIRSDATVVEFWPGAGWWTEIIAPYLAGG